MCTNYMYAIGTPPPPTVWWRHCRALRGRQGTAWHLTRVSEAPDADVLVVSAVTHRPAPVGALGQAAMTSSHSDVLSVQVAR